MTPRAPTPAQMRAMERLDGGDVLHYVSGLSPRAWFRGGPTLHMGTLLALRAAGWIEAYKPDVKHVVLDPNYRITPAGRRTLAEHRAQERKG